MPTASQKAAFLPPGAGAFFKRRASELIGLALFLGAIGLLLALLTYRPADPSLNTAELSAAKKLSRCGTTEPIYFRTSSG